NVQQERRKVAEAGVRFRCLHGDEIDPDDWTAIHALYERTFLTGSGEVQGPYNVAPGEVWVLGDNRNNSHDSRGWFEGKGGGVPFANVKGRALFVWLSFENTGKVAWERLLVNVMGKPRLPPEQATQLAAGVEKCFAQRPPLSETTPPAAPR
nr:S26 family signal peptidase [Polyangiaceae bacterium]